ncbi:MAG: maleylacetoacetate isomerase [Chromatocurvus sp.]
MQLYSYFRSSASYRVRIALNLKGIDHGVIPINLVAGEQRGESYRRHNPQGLVPTLITGDTAITQSTAILEWLEERHPEPALYPQDTLQRARVRALCQLIACDIHPLNNLRVLKYLKGELEQDEEAVQRWYAHWVIEGFTTLEDRLPQEGFVNGEAPGMAEAYLVPQVYNAERFAVPMAAFPRISSLRERCDALPEFQRAHPDAQPDAP